MTVQILRGDSLSVLVTLPADSYDCCVTSPPYWAQRDYGSAGQLGQESSMGEYIDALVAVFAQVRRALKPDGTLWLNLGDSYIANAGGGQGLNGDRNDRRSEKRASGRRSDGLKRKDLCMVPARVAIALCEDGWYLRSQIVWNKPSPTPESVKDRPTQAHEMVYLLSKSERYFYDADSVRETSTTAGYDGRNLRNVWTIPAVPSSIAHTAMMPPRLAEICISAGSKVGGHVLDPFGGAGTTGLVASQLRRNATLIEISDEYAASAERRIWSAAPLFADYAQRA